MLKDLKNLTEAEQQEHLDRFIRANDEQKFPQVDLVDSIIHLLL